MNVEELGKIRARLEALVEKDRKDHQTKVDEIQGQEISPIIMRSNLMSHHGIYVGAINSSLRVISEMYGFPYQEIKSMVDDHLK